MSSCLFEAAASAYLDVVISSFEDSDVSAGAGFDLAVAATSFHWVNQEVGLTKLGRALRPAGWVALWWTHFRDPAPPDDYSKALDHILGGVPPRCLWRTRPPPIPARRVA